MRKSIIAAGLVLASTAAGAAEIHPYIGTNDIFDPFNNARIGFAIDSFRVEGDFRFAQEKQKEKLPANTKIDTTSTTFGITGLYDIKTGSNITPFVGLGIASSSSNDKAAGVKNESFGYNVQGGVAFEVVKNFNLDVVLKYESDKVSKPAKEKEKNDLSLGLGARYAF